MYGIRFNGKHSYHDMGFTMPFEGREIGFPAKNKITVTVPFSNEEYDFSELYGGQSYGSRTLKYNFNLYKRGNWSHTAMEFEKIRLINWLMDSNGRQRLEDDDIPGYYFLAEVEDAASIQDDFETGTLSVTFRAYPFKISDKAEGDDIWDTFNFETDVVQYVHFTVDTTQDIVLYNVGPSQVSPKITTTAPMQIVKDGITYTIDIGETESEDFVLMHGENPMTINGTGDILFTFYKELI